METTLKKIHEYNVVYEARDYYRNAKIIFEDGVFKSCSYQTYERNKYDLKDWDWIGRLAQEIKRLVEAEGN